jgi:hypothetical protein
MEKGLDIPHILQHEDGTMILPNLRDPSGQPDIVVPVKLKRIPF